MSIAYGLERLERTVGYLPVYTRPTCHVTGTNGKGSVTAILSSVFTSSSPPFTVGTFNSPHLISVNDCICINSRPVDRDLYDSVLSQIKHIDVEHGIQLSNFEILTLTALQIFERLKVDIAIVEVGMGGRLDATNIIPDDAILISTLTNVDLDHQAFLGNTVSAIAREKAGIAREGRPFVIGPQRYADVIDSARIVVEDRGGYVILPLSIETLPTPQQQLVLRPADFQLPPSQRVSFSLPAFPGKITTSFGLIGEHQVENLTTAVTVISALLTHETSLKETLLERITAPALSEGIRRVRWPGRLSFHVLTFPKPLIALVDGAHNSASACTLGNYISHVLHAVSSSHQILHLTYVLALSYSPQKNPLEILFPILCPKVPNGIDVKLHVVVLPFSPPEGMPWVQSVPTNELAKVARGLVPDAELRIVDADAKQPLVDAMEWAASKTTEAGLVVVAGSLYLVSDFYRLYNDRPMTADHLS